MKSISSLLAALAVTSTLALAADEKPTPAKEGSAPVKPDATAPATPAEPAAAGGKGKADPEAMFKKLDTNGDGSISLEEMKASPRGKKEPEKVEEMFKRKDKDNDGKLTLEEFKAGGGKKKEK